MEENRERELAEICCTCCLALNSNFVAYLTTKLIDICCVMCVEVVFQKSFQMVT